jgi:hypothetical protein
LCCILNPTEKQVSSWVPIENFLLQTWSLLFNKSWIEELRAKPDDKVGIKRFLHIWELNQNSKLHIQWDLNTEKLWKGYRYCFTSRTCWIEPKGNSAP